MVDELIDRTEMELDYRLEAENQRAFAKAYDGNPDFVVPARGGQRAESRLWPNGSKASRCRTSSRTALGTSVT